MKAYICCFMISAAIISASLIATTDVQQWDEARIQNAEAAINELITANEFIEHENAAMKVVISELSSQLYLFYNYD